MDMFSKASGLKLSGYESIRSASARSDRFVLAYVKTNREDSEPLTSLGPSIFIVTLSLVKADCWILMNVK